MAPPHDAVLLIAFGAPARMEDVRPFLANVVRGRRVPPERIEEVVHHYARFDGHSPLTELTQRQARALEADLASLLQTTSDRAEGIAAFTQRRPPTYLGR